jgi:hypothetical protein
MNEQAAALRWIVRVLQRLSVPFQAVGGLAARAYGARRPLHDLDFYVPTDRLGDVAEAVAAHVTRPPTPHRDENWDLVFMKLEYDGCVIELGGADGAQYFDQRAQCWRTADIDFESSVEMAILGIRVPTMPLDQLRQYKTALDRDVDQKDVQQMAASDCEGAGENRHQCS